jgi:hypothetical protein
MWDPRHLTPLWVSTSCYRDSFTFYGNFYAGPVLAAKWCNIACGLCRIVVSCALYCGSNKNTQISCETYSISLRRLLKRQGFGRDPHPRFQFSSIPPVNFKVHIRVLFFLKVLSTVWRASQLLRQ